MKGQESEHERLKQRTTTHSAVVVVAIRQAEVQEVSVGVVWSRVGPTRARAGLLGRVATRVLPTFGLLEGVPQVAARDQRVCLVAAL